MLKEICECLVVQTEGESKTAHLMDTDRWQSMIAALEESGTIKRGMVAKTPRARTASNIHTPIADVPIPASNGAMPKVRAQERR